MFDFLSRILYDSGFRIDMLSWIVGGLIFLFIMIIMVREKNRSAALCVLSGIGLFVAGLIIGKPIYGKKNKDE